MTKTKLSLLAIAVLSLSACGFETAPVHVQTTQGDVECQLYTHNMVAWDRAISYPSSLTSAQADRVCWDLGYQTALENRGLR